MVRSNMPFGSIPGSHFFADRTVTNMMFRSWEQSRRGLYGIICWCMPNPRVSFERGIAELPQPLSHKILFCDKDQSKSNNSHNGYHSSTPMAILPLGWNQKCPQPTCVVVQGLAQKALSSTSPVPPYSSTTKEAIANDGSVQHEEIVKTGIAHHFEHYLFPQ
jgi:hypothetical protein